MKNMFLPILFLAALTACQPKPTHEPAPDRVITDTLAQQILRSWDLPMARGAQQVNATVTTREKLTIPMAPEVAQALTKLAPEAETFLLRTDRDNTILGKKGTTVYFPANCFAKHGEEVTGEVMVQLKECYTTKDLWQNNLNTNNQQTFYSTKCAVSILAFYEGEAVDVKDGSAMTVTFGLPAAEAENMVLSFGGRQFDGTMQWKNVEKVETSALQKNTAPKLFVADLSLEDYLAEKLHYPDEAKRNELSAKVTATVAIDETGKAKKVVVNSPYKTFRDELENTIYAMPNFVPAKRGETNVSSKMTIAVNFDIRQKQQVMVNADEKSVVYSAGGSEATPEHVSLHTTRLGWLACQAPQSTTAAKAQVVVPSDEHTNFKLVMKNKQVVVAAENYGSHVQFSALPLGETATVVGVKVINGESYFFQQNISLSSQHIVTPVWTKKQVVI